MDIESCYQLGARHKEQGNLVEAERCFREIVEHAPDLPDPHHSLGVVLQLQERLPEAMEHYRAAIALDPCFVKAHYNLATALWESSRHDEAIVWLRKTVALDHLHAEAHLNLGMLLMLTGNMAEGLKEYEWRWHVRDCTIPKRDFGKPAWDGSPLAGRVLLIHSEQGYGDLLQFIRYVPMAAASGGKVIVSAPHPLHALFAGVEGVVAMVGPDGPFPEFDVQIPILSLPFAFGTTSETIPAQIPYLRPDPVKVAAWQGLLAGDTCFRVGLVWQGSRLHHNDSNRSIPLALLAPLWEVAGVSFYTLQLGEGATQVASLSPEFRLIDLTDRIADFSDTAAMIANLDLVITVDTAMAHLSGALGGPVWVALPHRADWRWGNRGEKTPWYPTMRLFRQTSPGDWHGVIDRVREELARLLDSAAYHKQRGIELLRAGAVEEAEQAFSAAIALDPADAEAYSNLGVTLDSQKKYGEALAAYRTALGLRPDFVQALFNMGNTHRHLEENPEARTCYEKALALFPGLVQAELCLAQIWKEEGDHGRARCCLERALTHEPGNAEVLHSLGETYQSEERFPEAIEAYQGALAVDPGHVKALNMLGSVFHLTNRFAAAEECYRKALALKPGTLTVLNNLGVLYQSQRRFAESVAVLRRAISIDPGYADGHWNLALTLLACGEYTEGWLEYEWRFKKTNPVLARDFKQPLWEGESLQGKTILLHCEQGLGDTFQFIRYALLVARREGRVVVECQTPALQSLLARVEGVSTVVANGEPLPDFDCHLPLMSLPLRFGTTLATVPSGVPYLFADQAAVARWCTLLGGSTSFKVGLVWAGSRLYRNDRNRSCRISDFQPLAQMSGVAWYSLQIGDAGREVASPPPGMEVIDLTARIRDFSDTAAFVANLDLVITVDTSVAHLAGGMGKQVWLLLPMAADWRWLTEREDTPWYPGMRLFRQSMAGDWQGMMESVASALQRYVQTLSVGSSNRISPGSGTTSLARENTHAGPGRRQPLPGRRAAGLKIGLAWAGRKSHPLDRMRSCPLAVFAPLAASENASFYGLQPGDGAEQAADQPPGLLLKDLGGYIHDFEDTAALIANLDLVISVDTAVAHLAGAMGKPVWLLLPHSADWRWMTDRDDSPWYPTMKLFRQPQPGDWGAVIREVASSLAQLSGDGTDEFRQQPHCCESAGTTPERERLERQLEEYLCERARNTTSPDAHLNAGAALALLGRHRAAIPCYRRALELSPEHVQAHLNLGFSLLALGEFAEGWQHHEWRHKMLDSALPPWPFLRQSDIGRHKRGTTLLVHCEQGYGDTIQLIRFIPLLADLGFQVTVTCQRELAALVGTVRDISRVVPHGESLPVCDLQALLFSLPLLFGTTLETIPREVPYLAPSQYKVALWRSRLCEAMVSV